MTSSTNIPRRSWLWIGAAFLVGLLLMAGIAALLTNIQARKGEASQYPLRIVQIGANELDPAVWGKNFPREYDSFIKTKDDTISTPYGGSKPINKLERYPILKRVWAGYAFSVDFNEERGHYYALIDQKETKRQQVVKQPGACANCHAAEAPLLAAEMGWEKFNAAPYSEIADRLHLGTSCRDCHNPATMELWISRPALQNALAERGVDLSQATRQEMRTYVCAQCHVEYYFKGDNKALTFPWSQGYAIEEIEKHYDAYGFKDWTHKETNAAMIKIQHPEFELYTTSVHYRSGVACADCHMPYVREGSIKVSDHWLRSPLTSINRSCQTCHKQTEEELKGRVALIQEKTAGLLRASEKALGDAMDAIVAAQGSGAGDADLAQPRRLHRQASMRYDFVMSENSTGFHSPQEAARVLANAMDLARQAQLAAVKVTKR